MRFNYCETTCERGKRVLGEYLAKNNSAYDAFIDFRCFVEGCLKSCPYASSTDITKTQKEEDEVALC